MLTTLMTWEPAKRRWRKLYKGKMYTISCNTLGTPPTKAGSATAANAWWRRKQVEIDAVPSDPVRDLLNTFRDSARSGGNALLADAIESEMEALFEPIPMYDEAV